jgi:hypothetical protein
MAKLTWDGVGERLYETGVDHGVLYMPNDSGVYNNGVAWNGLTTVTEKPTGAEANPQFADNIKYLNLFSAEEFGATIEAFTYPDEFAQYDGLVIVDGVAIAQQPRKTFGLCYRTKIGNDVEGDDLGYKLHLVYGCTASPSEKAYSTINDSPEALAFSWEITTIPVLVTDHKPSSLLVIDSTAVDATALAALELLLYGDTAVDPALPLPDAVLALFAGTFTELTPDQVTAPTFNSGTNTITIPTTTGVDYTIDGAIVAAGDVVITADTLVVAQPKATYVFGEGVDNDWFFNFT